MLPCRPSGDLSISFALELIYNRIQSIAQSVRFWVISGDSARSNSHTSSIQDKMASAADVAFNEVGKVNPLGLSVLIDPENPTVE